jgi:hypothetical protein
MATVLDLAFGNAYWIKIRNVIGEVVQLWWVPRYMMWPRWSTDGKTYITHYDYLTFGRRSRSRRTTSCISASASIRATSASASRRSARCCATSPWTIRRRSSRRRFSRISASSASSSRRMATCRQQRSELEGNEDLHPGVFSGENRGKALTLSCRRRCSCCSTTCRASTSRPLRDVSEERVCAALGIPRRSSASAPACSRRRSARR